ncbi:hypothetical protein F383_24922 [Gossypium arboreum]|uniref:Uncharacterized protein n=1 Tax=Gossypium arboreum TaxID=29729 RepID=A0A0B0MIW8_GOSAR|nr:hypothetical protein F383_24922 [Gossypium arboreum]
MGSNISKLIAQLWSYTMFSYRYQCLVPNMVLHRITYQCRCHIIDMVLYRSHQPKDHDIYTVSIPKVQPTSIAKM